jgi:hypothetical protein
MKRLRIKISLLNHKENGQSMRERAPGRSGSEKKKYQIRSEPQMATGTYLWMLTWSAELNDLYSCCKISRKRKKEGRKEGRRV